MAKRCNQCSQRPGTKYFVVTKYHNSLTKTILCDKCLSSRTGGKFWGDPDIRKYFTTRIEAHEHQVTTAIMQHL